MPPHTVVGIGQGFFIAFRFTFNWSKTMKMKIYAYESEYGSIYPWKADDDKSVNEIDEQLKKYRQIRLSEFIEVDFPELSQDVVIENQINAIDSIITKKEGEHFAAIQELKQKRQELLAITYQGDGNE